MATNDQITAFIALLKTYGQLQFAVEELEVIQPDDPRIAQSLKAIQEAWMDDYLDILPWRR